KDATIAEEDRTAARTLLRGRRRVRKRPFYEKVWFQAVAISAVLLGLGGVLYVVFKPAGADQVFQEIEEKMKDPDNWSKVRDGPIADFLARFPGDPRRETVRGYAEKIDVARERRHLFTRMQLARSLGLAFEGENEFEKLAYLAERYEEFGDLPMAQSRWQV